MKKIKSLFLLICLFLLVGCATNTEKPTSSPTPSSTIIPTATPAVTSIPGETIISIPELRSVYVGDADPMFKTMGIGPTTIILFEKEASIQLLYETENKEKLIKKDVVGMYNGTMTKIAENVYSVSGEYNFVSLEKYEGAVSKDIDFYVVRKEDELFIVFEEKTLEDLMKYDVLGAYTLQGGK